MGRAASVCRTDRRPDSRHVPWSRLFDSQKVLLAINTDADSKRKAWVTIDARLHAEA
jgi:hypothetical protein